MDHCSSLSFKNMSICCGPSPQESKTAWDSNNRSAMECHEMSLGVRCWDQSAKDQVPAKELAMNSLRATHSRPWQLGLGSFTISVQMGMICYNLWVPAVDNCCLIQVADSGWRNVQRKEFREPGIPNTGSHTSKVPESTENSLSGRKEALCIIICETTPSKWKQRCHINYSQAWTPTHPYHCGSSVVTWWELDMVSCIPHRRLLS